MFYENYVALCRDKGESPSKAAQNAGLSKTAVTGWKQNPNALPSPSVLQKLCTYFGVGQEALLGEQQPAQSFYEHYIAMCRSRGVSPSRAAEDAGLSKSAVSKWKREPDTVPSGAVLAKLSAYFGVPTSQLLGEPTEGLDPMGEEAVKFALFGGREDITPEMYEEVRSFAQFVMEREARKRRNSG